jgi:hypothetical protein
MGHIIQFPRPNPRRRWSPEEILAIKEEPDDKLRQSRERSRIGSTQKIASEASKREAKKVERKEVIADVLSDGQQWTVARIMRLVEYRTRQPISRTTVTALLKELETEEKVSHVNQFWFNRTHLKL